jgi:hypothetical protein
MSLDRLRTSRKWMIPFVVSLSNHQQDRLVQHFPRKRVVGEPRGHVDEQFAQVALDALAD